ncbi:riboflavin biosynthesis protein RibD [Beggiatoa alba B18LD]|uniref:Riboflavin biosynthesis protein RibD n=1 Tax=Beggiatoa alba B18LD TaxID=395493 RepID=I3CJ97_9GAMM|nr:bifunctional diaminohydroxyphosphoribosylaminopyrimidine deaminase/5-amino-6-(5-phosphoribosylamino)uracil reductase RibD [Beggiatoa alba]EIJ43690.1 riboflavin biosynthesis protein RibD [Beggiatoa alba B18LD]
MNQLDQYYMARALHLAERGLWSTDPNPRVGCVIVRDGEIVGEGWHEVAGEPHAEIYALQMAKEKAQGATCYVTLEPCCHHGRTPPCTDALIKAGITRVVAASTDPNPIVASKGIEQLNKAGIVVNVGVLGAQAEQLNAGFFMRMRRNRPYIRCKLAMSLDGRTAMASGESQWITSQDARRDVQGLRARSSAVMTGAGTILADNPRLSVRESELPQHLYKPKIIRQPIRAIVDAHLSCMPPAHIFDKSSQTIVFTASRNETIKAMLTEAGAHVLSLPRGTTGDIDLQEMCYRLATDYHVNELLLETGATLSGSMLKAGLIDEIVIYMAPVLMGNKARGLFNLPEIELMKQRLNLHITDIRAVGCDWRITAQPAF